MKKLGCAAIAAALTIALLSCATGGGMGDGLSLQEAIGRTAENALGNLPPGTRVAIVAFETESDGLSEFIMDELANALMGLGIEVADRRNLGLVTRELDLSLDGSVSDESALSIGRMQAAQVVITGRLLDMANARRFIVTAIHVETATGVHVPNLDVRNDRALQNMVAALGGRTQAEITPASSGDRQAAPRTAGDFLDRGMLFISRSDFDTAIMDFDEAIRLNPNFAEAFFWRGLAHMRASDVDFSSIVPFLMFLMDDDRTNLAIADLDEAIRLNTGFAAAYMARGKMRSAFGHFESAIADFTQAIRIEPNNASAYSNRANAHLQSGDTDRAIADFTQVIQIEPNNASAYISRASAHLRSVDRIRAIADFTQAIRLGTYSDSALPHRDLVQAHLSRGDVHFSRGDLDLAIDDYTQALQLDPNDEPFGVWIRGSRGHALYLRGDYDQAIADIEVALRASHQVRLRGGNLIVGRYVGELQELLESARRRR